MQIWSLVTYRLPGDSIDRAGILRSDGIVCEAEQLRDARGLMDVTERWNDVAKELHTFDPFRAKVVNDAHILAPLRFPHKLIAAGANYLDHIREMGAENLPSGLEPFFFLLPASNTIIGPEDEIELPSTANARVDWEAELAVVIGQRGRNISVEDALNCVAGYTIINDISARGLHRRPKALAAAFEWDWLSSKGLDTFCPMGPGITPSWFVPDPQALRIQLWVNGNLKQDGNTKNMVFDVRHLISAASRTMTLEPGDVIATGTPAGVGMGRNEFLVDGDVVTIEIESLGKISNRVRNPGQTHSS